jgi:hypothetical protein
MTLPDPDPTLAPRPEVALDQPTLLEAAKSYVEAAKARNTRRAYRTQWRTFAAWCAQFGRESLPAAPATLALFLTARAQAGLKSPRWAWPSRPSGRPTSTRGCRTPPRTPRSAPSGRGSAAPTAPPPGAPPPLRATPSAPSSPTYLRWRGGACGTAPWSSWGSAARSAARNSSPSTSPT